MPDFVLHGEGQPRLDVITPIMLTNTIGSIISTTFVLGSGANLTRIDREFGLMHSMVSTFTSADVTTFGKVTDWDDGTDTIVVDSWSNGTPAVGKAVTIQGLQIDLPFCQKLTETFRPDFIEKKMHRGDIRTNRRGFYYSATLDYARFAHKDTVILFRALFNKQYSDYTFFPRSDNSLVQYKVD